MYIIMPCFVVISVFLLFIAEAYLIQYRRKQAEQNGRIVTEYRKSDYQTSVTEIVLFFENKTEKEESFGEKYQMQIFADNEWETIPFAEKGSFFNALSYTST